MGRVIDLAAWRERRELVARDVVEPDPEHQPLQALERAIARLDRRMREGTGRIGRQVETELLAITRAVSAGRVQEAAERAERLAERLEHPSSRMAR